MVVARRTLSLLALLPGWRRVEAADPLWLVTQAEASLPAQPGASAIRAITRGPAIRYLAPQDAPVRAQEPFRLHLEFAGRGGARIEGRATRVTLLRGSGLDITARLLPFLGTSGLDVPQALTPAGLFALRVEASDDQGRQSMAVIQIDVR